MTFRQALYQQLASQRRARGLSRALLSRRPGVWSMLALLALSAAACSNSTEPKSSTIGRTTTTRLSPLAPDPSTIAFMSNRKDSSDFDIWVMHGDGSAAVDLTDNPHSEGAPAWSADGTRIAFERNDGPNDNIAVMNRDGSTQHLLTAGPDAVDANPSWSPDGIHIAFERKSPAGKNSIFVMNSDGSGQHPVTTSEANDANPSWSPDGTRIAFQRPSPQGHTVIFVMGADGQNQHALTNGAAADTDPAWSPDGNRVVFARATQQGHSQIRVVNSDGSGDLQLTAPSESVDGAPTWSPDGVRIAFYRQEKNQMGGVWSMKADGTDQRKLTDSPSINTLPSWTAAVEGTVSGNPG